MTIAPSVTDDIYFDNAATTKPDSQVVEEMMCWIQWGYGNPSSLHSQGRTAKKAIKEAREQVAKSINAEPSQIFFTSGATESNTWVCSNYDWVLCSEIEHPSILRHNNTIAMGRNNLANEIYSNIPNLVSIMMVNNETGLINNVKAMCDISHKMNVPFHTDATQAFGHMVIDVKDIDCDYLSLSGHKFYAPKGIGILYVKDPSKIKPLFRGGHQENGLRAGTENVASIVAIGKACELFDAKNETVQEQSQYIKSLKTHLKEFIIKNFDKDDYIINDQPEEDKQADNILSVSFKGLEAESIMLMLDSKGFCVGSGSACSSGSLKASPTLEYLNIPEDYIHGTIRFSFGKYNQMCEIESLEKELKDTITKLKAVQN